jgi:hypothetical protein
MVKFYKNKDELKIKLYVYLSKVMKHMRNELNLEQNDTDILTNTFSNTHLILSEENSHNNEIKFNIDTMTLTFRIGKDDKTFTIFRGDIYHYKNLKTIKRNIIQLFNYGTCSDFKNHNPTIRNPRKVKYDNTEFKMFIDILNEHIMEYKIPYKLNEPYIENDEDETEDDLFYKYHSIEDFNYCNCYCNDCDECNVSFWCYLRHPHYPVVFFKKPKPVLYTEITETFECPISMTEVNEGYITICKHKFGKENLIEWLKVDDKKSCPMCRTKLIIDN